MSQQHLQYNPSECINCEACLIYCPINCISLNPLTIMPDCCIECEQCINNCPEGEKVLRMAYNDELGGGWISPFGHRLAKITKAILANQAQAKMIARIQAKQNLARILARAKKTTSKNLAKILAKSQTKRILAKAILALPPQTKPS